MIGNMTKQHLMHSFNKAIVVLGHASTRRTVFYHVDHGVRTFEQIYVAVAPLVDKHANRLSGKMHSNIIQARRWI